MKNKDTYAQNKFLRTRINKSYLILNVVLAFVYFAAILLLFPRGNTIIFWVLVAGEVFHLWQVYTYLHAIWGMDRKVYSDKNFTPEVDVFITVAGEPLDIIEKTVLAAKNMEYPNFNVYILNDGKVAGKDNWQDVEKLAKKSGVNCITREMPGGAKAGNVNNALKETFIPFVVVFDADHYPHSDFLKKTVGYFADEKIAFVQTPQYYRNHKLNYITDSAWEQQELFFGPLCRGKNRTNSVFMCGTNMVIRRKALEEVGGLNEENITEDLVTALAIHGNGWRSTYVPEVLAEGLAPEDLLSYYKQQTRWARGSLEVIFRYNPLFKKNLTWHQKIQYLASSSFYLSGWIVLMNALLPVIYLFTAQAPFEITTPLLALVFLPYIFMTVYVLMISSNYSYTYRAVSFSMSLFMVHIMATLAAIFRRKSAFVVTPKKQVSGNFIKLAIPHILYIAIASIGLGVAIAREGISAAVIANLSWVIFTIALFTPFIIASLPEHLRDTAGNIQPRGKTVKAETKK